MSWLQFSFSMLGIYLLYYGGNFGYDLLNAGGSSPGISENAKVIHFDQDTPPIAVLVEAEEKDEIDYFISDDDPETDDPVIYSSGGISLKELFILARSEAIEVTNSVSF